MPDEILLSVCIPTFNRARLLERAIRSVATQVKFGVEVLVSDNASSDGTAETCAGLGEEFPFFRYSRNESNLGWHGNTAKCIELAKGKYIALLGDDDSYLPGLVPALLELAAAGKHSLINLNYIGEAAPDRLYAPEKDMEFRQPYQVLEHPSVGHFSGFVYNSSLAKKALLKACRSHSDICAAELLYIELAVRICSDTTLPAFFLGKRLLFAGQPPYRGYKWMLGPYLADYKCYVLWFREGLISSDALEFRKRLLLLGLPRAILTSIHELEQHEVREAAAYYVSEFSSYPAFWLRVYPLLLVGKMPFFRGLLCALNRTLRQARGRKI